MRTYYLAGPMTGIPEYNYPEFARVAAELRRAGMEIRSPHEHFTEHEDVPGQRPWYEYMVLGIRMLLDCTDIILLEGWHKSKGAVLECMIADKLGMQVSVYRYGQVYVVHQGTRPEHG